MSGKRPTSEILSAKANDSRRGGPSFALRHRAFRAFFALSWWLLARWTPRPLHRWRAGVLRLFGADIHPTARIYPSVTVWYPPNLRVGRYATIGPGATIYCMETITIGECATISQGAHLCAGTHDIDDPDFQLVARPIDIGRAAWVAAEAFVGPGVTIAEGAVLGARGVAVKNLERLGVYAGNPARLIRHRSPVILTSGDSPDGMPSRPGM